MPRYSVKCGCNRDISVELFQAGMQVECAECHRKVTVPSITTLKMESGDKHPWLTTWQKTAQTKANHEPPFDGVYQKCRERPAENQTPVKFEALHQRVEAGQSSIPVPGLGRVKIQHFDETWNNTTFPLLMCETCQQAFQSHRRSSKFWGFLKFSLLTILIGSAAIWVLMGFASYMDHPANEVSGRSVAFTIRLLAAATIGIIVVVRRFRKRTRTYQGDRYSVKWLSDIPLVRDLIESEDECRITVGKTSPWKSRATTDQSE